MAQFASQVQFGIESRRTAPSSHRTCGEHREAIEVFLKFLKTFSSEKVFKPPEALAAKPRTPREARDWSEATNTRKKALKGSGGKQEFSPSVCVDFRQHKRASRLIANLSLTAVQQSNGTHSAKSPQISNLSLTAPSSQTVQLVKNPALFAKQAYGTTGSETLPKITGLRIFGSVSLDFGGSMPPKSTWLRRSQPLFAYQKSGDIGNYLLRAAVKRYAPLRFIAEIVFSTTLKWDFYAPT